MKILFIDDQKELIQTTVLDNLPPTMKTEICPFEDAESRILSFRPDIVVLDLRRDGSESGPNGIVSFEAIWKHRFRPIVVFSAYPEMLQESQNEHPFVVYVKKGATGYVSLLEAIQRLQSQVQSIANTEREVDIQVSIALRDVAPIIHDQFTGQSERNEAILRTAQRRIAAMLDETSLRKSTLRPWEQYVFPPVVSDIITGDVIKKKVASVQVAEDFAVVLSPSCDLVASEGRTPKIKSVLVGRGQNVNDGCAPLSLPQQGDKRLKKLENHVGHLHSGIFFLPEIPSKMPSICINLKNLMLIPIEELMGSEPIYERIASIDSPFREEIVWFLLQTLGRPGVPDRDKAEWAKSIHFSASNESK
jgi:hypothetical protein